MEMEMGEVLGRRMGGGMVIGWFAVGREMRKRGGGVEGLTKGMNGVSWEEDFDRKEVALRD